MTSRLLRRFASRSLGHIRRSWLLQRFRTIRNRPLKPEPRLLRPGNQHRMVRRRC